MAKKVKAKKKAVPRKRIKQKRLKHSDVPKKGGGGYQPNAVKASMGNQWWMLRSKHGASKIFENPLLMWDASIEYFQWCIDNPLYECKPMSTKWGIEMVEVPKVRAFTLHGLCLYLGVNTDYFRTFKNSKRVKGEDFEPVIKQIEEIIYKQKFEHAACDQLNANIISRDLGLADTQKIDVSAERKTIAELFPPELDSE